MMNRRKMLARCLGLMGLSACVAPRSLWGQETTLRDGALLDDNVAFFVVKNVLLFARGKKALQDVRILETRHNMSGPHCASVVTLQYALGKKRHTATVTMQMVHKPGMRRLYGLTFRDDRGGLLLPEQLLEVRERLNALLIEEDLLINSFTQRIAFEELPLIRH